METLAFLIMKIYIDRISNDNLINLNGKPTHENFLCSPDNFNHEAIGWIYQQTKYNKKNDIITFYFVDMTSSEDILIEALKVGGLKINLYDNVIMKSLVKFYDKQISLIQVSRILNQHLKIDSEDFIYIIENNET